MLGGMHGPAKSNRRYKMDACDWRTANFTLMPKGKGSKLACTLKMLYLWHINNLHVLRICRRCPITHTNYFMIFFQPFFVINVTSDYGCSITNNTYFNKLNAHFLRLVWRNGRARVKLWRRLTPHVFARYTLTMWKLAKST